MKSIKLAIFVFFIGILFMVSGVSLALFRENIEGSNKEFITGDIWMKYTGSNQLVINDMTPSDGVKVLKTFEYAYYTYNENPTEEQVNGCLEVVNDWYFWHDEQREAYCRGTGTKNGYTISEEYEGYKLIENVPEEFVELNILTKSNEIPTKRFIYTSLEYNKEVTEEEINLCTQLNFSSTVDDGFTKEDYCRGIGTIEGKTLLERIKYVEESDIEDTGVAYYWLVEEISPFIASNVIKPVVDMPYFEFTIDGKNTYTKKDIIYEIVLNHGANHETRGTRIKDEDLQFTLIEVDEDGNYVDILLSKQKYFDLNNKRIWVDRVPANSNTEVNKTYRLYMNIANDTIVGNVNQDYTMDEWNDVFASIKVGVNGDFNEKELESTDARCFEGEAYELYSYNENITEDGINACIEYFQSESFDEGTTVESYCRGTGTIDGMTIKEYYKDIGFGGEYSEDFLIQNNILVLSGYTDYMIKKYDTTCGGNLIFPETIDGKAVNFEWRGYVEGLDNLISVTLSSGITRLDNERFFANPILDVFIPSNVTYLSCIAFDSDVNITFEGEPLTCEFTPDNG